MVFAKWPAATSIHDHLINVRPLEPDLSGDGVATRVLELLAKQLNAEGLLSTGGFNVMISTNGVFHS